MRRCLQSFRSCYLRFLDFSLFAICARDLVYLIHQGNTSNTREKMSKEWHHSASDCCSPANTCTITIHEPGSKYIANKRNRSAVLLLVWYNTSPSSQILTACSLAMRPLRKGGTFSPDSIPTIKHPSISNLFPEISTAQGCKSAGL